MLQSSILRKQDSKNDEERIQKLRQKNLTKWKIMLQSKSDLTQEIEIDLTRKEFDSSLVQEDITIEEGPAQGRYKIVIREAIIGARKDAAFTVKPERGFEK